jgi:hypothetical protein
MPFKSFESRLEHSLAGLKICAVLLLCWLGVTHTNAQHAHINAGAYEHYPGAPLVFPNGYLWDTNSYSGIYPACIFMVKDDPNVRLYPGLYQTDVSFTALPATIFTGGPALYAAEPNTYIELIVRSVQGPPGGVISVWQEDDEFAATSTTRLFSMTTGTRNGTQRFNLTQSPEQGGWEGDPYGHVHGRRFTASLPGLYTVGVQLIDTSTAGPGGTPNHSPSETNYFYFQAGLVVQLLKKTNTTAVLRFGLQGFKDYYLEASDSLDTPNWTEVGREAGATHSDLHTLLDTNAVNATRFYRVREVLIQF